MRKVTKLQDIQDVVNMNGMFYTYYNGTKLVEMNVVTVLTMTVIEAIRFINDGQLFYDMPL